MAEKDHFKQLMDVILEEVLKETKRSKKELPVVTTTVLDILVNLNEQIAEQKEHINRLEEKIEKNEHDFKLLLEELRKEGLLKIRERRHLFRRFMLTNEAVINLLARNRVINQKDFRAEIKMLNKKHSKIE
jgi:hypothetical protein